MNIAIIGGGFTGAALAYHLARRDVPGLNITVFEPRAELGAGLAYSTADPAHRLNARAQRMSLVPDEPAHFCDWIAQAGACLDDEVAVLADGRIFPRRAVYGRYIAAQLSPFLVSGAIRHVRAAVSTLSRGEGAWRIAADGVAPVTADVVVLATGHAPPEAPARLGAVFAGQKGFIGNPTLPGAMETIGREDRVLIIGTGLTMADAVAALHRRGHAGPILAVSRRGQSPRSHALRDVAPFGDFAATPALTALDLLKQVRAALAAARAENIGWQAVFDGVRCHAQALWQALPAPERRRMLRHLRPFWDVHRHRMPPQIAAILARRVSTGALEIRAASVGAGSVRNGKMTVALRRRGASDFSDQDFDAIVITTGPGRPETEAAAGPLPALFNAGWIRPDEHGQGLDCDDFSRAINTKGVPSFHLLIAGPLARGHFGELMSVPEIALQVDALAARIAGAGYTTWQTGQDHIISA